MAIMIKTIVSTVANLSRKCPKCGRKQVVPKSESDRPVSCKYCGTEIPPRNAGKERRSR